MDYSHLMRTPEQVDELFPWLRKDLIRGIPHPISPAWNHDRSHFDPEYYAECWERIGFTSVELLTGHHDGYLLYPSKLQKQQPDRDYFGEQVAACRKRGIRVIAYYSLTLDSRVGSEHPQWRVRDLAGRIHQPNFEQFSHYHWLCLNSGYRDYAVAQLEEVVDNYDVEGVWIDILYLPGHTEDLEHDTCFCDDCHRQYTEWFPGEHLLDAAGTPRHDEFRALTYRNFLAQTKTMLMSKDRPLLLSFNGAGRRRMPGYKICDDLTDFFSGEAHNPTSLTVTSKSHRHSGRVFELMSCSEVCWSHNQLKPNTLIKLESLSTLLAGGTYTQGITHAPDMRLSRANIERLVEWGQWTRARADLFRPAEPVYEIGMLAPELGPAGVDKWAEWLRKGHFLFDVFMDVPGGQSDCRAGTCAPPAVGSQVASGGVQAPALQQQPTPGAAQVRALQVEGLDCRKVIVVPSVRPLSQTEAEALRGWVERGGKLLLEYPAAAMRDHQPWLETLVGARLLREPAAYAFFLSPQDETLAANLPAASSPQGDPVMLYAKSVLQVELTTGRQVGQIVQQFMDKVRTSDIQTVANFWARPDQKERWPGIIVNQVGEGQVMLVCAQLTVANRDEDRCPWPEMLAQNCVQFLLGEQMVSAGAYNQIEVNLCRQPQRQVLHFTNHMYGHGNTISGYGEEVFLREVPVRLSPKLRASFTRATLEPEGAPLQLTEQGFILPKLGVYQAVGLWP